MNHDNAATQKKKPNSGVRKMHDKMRSLDKTQVLARINGPLRFHIKRILTTPRNVFSASQKTKKTQEQVNKSGINSVFCRIKEFTRLF